MKIQGSRQNPEMRQRLELRESEGPQVESLSFWGSLISCPVSALMSEEPAVEVRGASVTRTGSSVPQVTPRAGAMESAQIGFATSRGVASPGGKVRGPLWATGQPTGRLRRQFCVAEGAKQMHVR